MMTTVLKQTIHTNHLIWSVIVAYLFSSCVMQNSEGEVAALQSFSDSLFTTSLDSQFIAGASVLVFQEGVKLLDNAYGYASLELAAPMPANASFEIGSVTKQFTAVAILKLVEDGKLALEDNITQYLDFDTGNRAVTIKMLLNHTSGIPSYTEMSHFWHLSRQREDRDSLVRLVEKEPFLFDPGEAMIYNNSAYFFLGLIIEKVSGMAYEDYLKAKIFSPLQMENTFYCSTSDVISDKAYGYNYTKQGLRQKPYLDHTWPYAAGSLCSTAEDLLTWMRALHSGQVLTKAAYAQLTQPDKLKNGHQLRYAMGLSHYSNFGHRSIGHGGGINGFLSETRYFPEQDLYIICLVNTTGPKGATYFAEALTWHLLTKHETQPVEMDVDLLEIQGKYVGQGRGRIISADVTSLSGRIILSIAEDSDTIQTYLGNNIWKNGNDIITFSEKELNMDVISGYYRLKKQ